MWGWLPIRSIAFMRSGCARTFTTIHVVSRNRVRVLLSSRLGSLERHLIPRIIGDVQNLVMTCNVDKRGRIIFHHSFSNTRHVPVRLSQWACSIQFELVEEGSIVLRRKKSFRHIVRHPGLSCRCSSSILGSLVVVLVLLLYRPPSSI